MFFCLIMRRSCKVPFVLSQMWNSVGIVRGYNDDQDNAIDVEFHDTAIHHAMHLTNTLGHTMADLSQEAVLLACEGTDELARYKILVLVAWGTDLQYDFSDLEWSEVCVRAQNLSINTRFKLLQYNWVMRTYITPEKFNKFNPNIPDVCFKCQKYKGKFFHCVWECDVIRTFWQKVMTLISSIILKPIPVTPEICVLGLVPVGISVSRYQYKMIDICLVLARRSIPFYWKKIEGPSIGHWLKDLSHFIVFEKLTYSNKGKLKDYYKIWDLFMQFLENNEMDAEGGNIFLLSHMLSQ